MSHRDRQKWDARYSQRDYSDTSVDPFLIECAKQLPSTGNVLDIAGGAGRNALFFADQGFNVKLIDISPIGLQLAQSTAVRQGVTIETQCLDLDLDELPVSLYEVIVCTWFLISPMLWKKIAARLAPNGRVIYIQPTLANLERHLHPNKRFLLNVDQLVSHLKDAGIRPLKMEQGWNKNNQHTLRLFGE